VPGLNEVRIKVAAAALNPADAAVWAGFFGPVPGDGGAGLGWDVAGTVDTVGPGAWFTTGEPVIALVHGTFLPTKGQAEYVVVPSHAVAPAPAGVAAAAAATIPLNGLTAAQSLELLGLPAGGTVLVTGAAGAVGGYAVQLGKRLGLTVIGLDDAQDEAYVRGTLLADDYLPRAADPAAALRARYPGGVDGVLDTATLGQAVIGAVRDGGTFVTTRVDHVPAAERGIRVRLTTVAADASRLTTLSDLAGAGKLALRVAQTYPLDEVAAAHARLAQGGLRGRLVLTF
jgi:NADPH:quinone reductase-like Zn-dependent oxidoreductase